MARLDDGSGKYLLLDILPLPARGDPDTDLISIRISVSDGIGEWGATVPALTEKELHMLAAACCEVGQGGNGGILPTIGCVIEFGIHREALFAVFDPPLIPPHDPDRGSYQVVYHPTSGAYLAFGAALLRELKRESEQ